MQGFGRGRTLSMSVYLHFLFTCNFLCVGFGLTQLDVQYVFLQAKKRQIQLDTTYGSSMRELELLLDSFQIEKPEEHKRPGDPSCMLIQ